MSKPKRHHYIPKVYLKQWEDKQKLIWYYNKKEKTVAHRNKDSVLYEEHLYSLTLREIYYLTPQQQEIFAEPLKEFDVYLDDKKLTTPEIIENLIRYNEFTIKKKDEKLVSHRQKGDLLEKVLNSKHFLIEEEYNRIENIWPDVVDFFENYKNMVLQNNFVMPKENTLKKYADELLNFILATYTRNPYNMLHRLEMLEQNHNIKLDNRHARTVFEKMQLLYLSGERNLFEKIDYDINLIFTTPETPFLTSDNPVILYGIIIENVGFTGIFWFPLSPNILVSLSKKQKQDQLSIKPYIAAKETVMALNDMIRQYAEECFVSSVNINDNNYRFINN